MFFYLPINVFNIYDLPYTVRAMQLIWIEVRFQFSLVLLISVTLYTLYHSLYYSKGCAAAALYGCNV